MAKAKPEAVEDLKDSGYEDPASLPSREKAKAALAKALARAPGIEGDLGDVIAYLAD